MAWAKFCNEALTPPTPQSQGHNLLNVIMIKISTTAFVHRKLLKLLFKRGKGEGLCVMFFIDLFFV